MSASSPELNKPTRSNREAATDITADLQRAEIERARNAAERKRRLGGDHPSWPSIRDGARQTIYLPDGTVIKIEPVDEVKS